MVDKMRISIILIFLVITGVASFAQGSIVTDDKSRLIQESRRLYADGEYVTTLEVIDKIDTRKLTASERQEMDLLRARATFETDHLEGRALLLQYLADYPETTQRNVIAALIGESYYYSHNFEQAAKWFKEADFNRLEQQEKERAELNYALTLQECGRADESRGILTNLSLTGKKHSEDALFHLAVTEYDNNNLEQAYSGFKKVELSDKYHLEVPYYLAGIYIKQGEYERARLVAEPFIADHGNKRQGIAMNHMLGAALFGQERYSEAIAPLKKYMEQTAPEKRQRIAGYQLALCYFETEQYDEAKTLFEQCCDKDDAIAQNSWLHLGRIYLNEKDTNAARMAFEQATNMSHDNDIREEAMYNYALCLHQTRYSPFAESVKIFERFLNEYPNSTHADQVNKYLVEVYMNTRNYYVALESINKIESPSPVILEAKQKVLYRLGVQEYINGNMDKAIAYFEQSTRLSEYDKETHSDALYWQGEAYYNKGNYAAAAKCYRSVLALGSNNCNRAIYGLGYTNFQTGNHEQAAAEFQRFIKMSGNEDNELRADAYNRIADCYFYKRNYKKAEEYYSKATETDKKHGDYALYRNAIAQGLRKDYNSKVATLSQLIEQYPESSYIQQAYYELGRSYIELEESKKAIGAFKQLTDKYPQSDLARRAAAEIAMIHNNDGNRSEAIKAYKEIINRYPQSEEAQVAAQDLKNIYIEEGNIEEYADFAKNTKGLQEVKSSEIDTLTYIAAEKTYGKSDLQEAKKRFKEYLQKFPNGAFTLDSHYNLGNICYGTNEKDEALKHFESVIAFPDNKYSEDAMAYASEIYFADKKYDKATELYKQIIAKSSDGARRKACRINLLRCAHNTGDTDLAITTAETLLSSADLTPETKREIQYYKAKALLKTGKGAEAEKLLASLAKDTRDIYGAEGKYLLAQQLFNREKFDDCEKEIFEYIENSTPHAYWLARSFILLSDVYAAQGRNTEAKQYLLSLKNNYSEKDDIEKMIEERLAKLSNEKQ